MKKLQIRKWCENKFSGFMPIGQLQIIINSLPLEKTRVTLVSRFHTMTVNKLTHQAKKTNKVTDGNGGRTWSH